jgi:hypothetical protein
MQYISNATDPTSVANATEDGNVKGNKSMPDAASVDDGSSPSTTKSRKSSTPSSRKSSRTSTSSQSPKTNTPRKGKASDEPADSPPSTIKKLASMTKVSIRGTPSPTGAKTAGEEVVDVDSD